MPKFESPPWSVIFLAAIPAQVLTKLANLTLHFYLHLFHNDSRVILRPLHPHSARHLLCFRFVLFKKHYDKYLHLSQKYEEARNIAYYLEEKYHEVKVGVSVWLFWRNMDLINYLQTERDDLIQQRERLSKRLESNECLLKEKEDEVFLQLERVVYLEEQCDRVSFCSLRNRKLL